MSGGRAARVSNQTAARTKGFGFRFLEFRVLGYRVLGFRVLGFRGLGFRVFKGLGF